MLQERITVITDGQVIAIGAGPPAFTSAGSEWSGFLLEEHVVQTANAETRRSWYRTHVGVCTAGLCEVQIHGGAGKLDYTAKPESICIFPSGCEETTIRYEGGGRFVVTELDNARLRRLYHDDEQESEHPLVPQLNLRNPHIVTLLRSMRTEIAAGCPAGPLYGESLSLALAAYLWGRYAAKESQAKAADARFTRAQLQRVLEFIHVHLGRDVSLLELAGTVHLSPRHFSRLFRNTIGMTPYRYVLSERVKEAKTLLATHRLAIVEVAQALGFANQSHFTEVFRKATGATPRRYQRDR